MDTIKTARELGKAIQADERYKAYYAAKEINDNDEGLQALIGEFNLIRQKLNSELSAMNQSGESGDKSKVESLNSDAQAISAKIMDNPSMVQFNNAKNEMDALIHEVSEIISLCCDGEDPETCQVMPVGCGSGGCAGCAGCG